MSRWATDRLPLTVRLSAWYALLWWVLARGERGSLAFGLLAVGLATATAHLVSRSGPVPRLSRIAGFFVFFGLRSLQAGLDVAVRALRPRMGLAPGLAHASLRAETAASHEWTGLVINLLPGTLTLKLDGHVLTLHLLDTRRPVVDEVSRVERAVAVLVGGPSGRE